MAINNLNNRDFWDFVIILGSIMSTVLLFLTYFLARKINRKIDKPIIEKQLTKVYELIEVLQNTSICLSHLRTIGNDKEIKFFEFKKNRDLYSAKTELVIQKSYYEKFEFLKYSNDPFIPKKIAHILERFNITFENIFEEKNSEYLVVGPSVEFMIKETNESKDFYTSLLHLKYYEDLENSIKEIITSIEDWIENPTKSLNLK